ncbi:MAG: A/G-specific adenine glycosylase [Nocardioides sp.]
MADPDLDLDLAALQRQVVAWYEEHARQLPWREPSASPWAVMVSEFMLQQTPVVRVLPVWSTWLERWSTPAALAAETPGEAVRAWGRLGYPRRALRLHAAAREIVRRHDGEVPRHHADLLALPGIGDYTASAIAAFAFGDRHVVLDTNVRRVLARARRGLEFPTVSISRAERDLAEELLPTDDAAAARWSVAVMELGALVCSAASPRCADCPVREACAWRSAGYPAYDGPPRRGQTYEGTDRQCRGRILAVARESVGPVHRSRIDAVWPGGDQRERCLASLVHDGLLTEASPGYFALP